jgi:excinuclease UvrABC nuclease subunit
MENQIVRIPRITLSWSDWTKWDQVQNSGPEVLPDAPGVYEVTRKPGAYTRLTIGKASKLRRRVLSGLVKGTAPHSSGKKIRDEEMTSKLYVRWAQTDRPSACEEHLHKNYKERFCALPEYTKVT